MADPRKEFDDDREQKTGQIVREDLVPRVARQGKAIYTIVGILAAVFSAGVTYQACSAKYQLASMALAQEAQHAEQHKEMQRSIDANASHIAEHDKLFLRFERDAEWTKQTLFNMGRTVGSRPAPPPKDGR